MNTLIILSFILCFISFAQFKIVDENNRKFICPMNRGNIKKIKNANSGGEIIDPTSTITIVGSDESVLSSSNGEVIKIIKTEDSLYSVMVAASKYNLFYVGLNVVKVNKKQKISIGQIIGRSFSKVLEFSIYNGDVPVEKPETLLNCKCTNVSAVGM